MREISLSETGAASLGAGRRMVSAKRQNTYPGNNGISTTRLFVRYTGTNDSTPWLRRFSAMLFSCRGLAVKANHENDLAMQHSPNGWWAAGCCPVRADRAPRPVHLLCRPPQLPRLRPP